MNLFKKLFITVLFLSMTSIGFTQNKTETTVKNVEPKALSAVLNTNKVQLLDVRTPNEFKSGHIKGSVNINYYDQDFSEQVLSLDKNKPVYVYCRSGVRSKYSSDILKKLGFKNIYNLKGGILNWSAQKLPLVK